MEVLADAAGLIVGTSISPEMVLVVFGVIWFATSPKNFLMAFVAGAVALIIVRVFVVSGIRGYSPADYPLHSIGAAVAALLLWSLIGWRITIAYQKRARA